MSASVSREAARRRMKELLEKKLDELIPLDESKPLKGSTLADWEEQGVTIAEALLPSFMEERASLDSRAVAERAGRCPRCGSEHTRFIDEERKKYLTSPYGETVITVQPSRCCDCGGTFSPSGSRLESSAGIADSQGRRADGPGRG